MHTARILTAGTGPAAVPAYRLAAVAMIVVMLAVGLAGIGLGLAQDRDSAAIEYVFPHIWQFHYVRSRSWGDPLYEILAAGLDALGGRVLVNLASVCFTLVYAGAIYRILRPDRQLRALLAFGAAILNPLVLSNSSAMMETALYLAAGLASAERLLTYLREQETGGLIGFLIATAIMILARPDSALFAIVIAGCLIAEWRHQPRLVARALVGLIITAVLVLGIYGLLNQGFSFLTPSVLGNKTLASRAARATLALLAIYGLVGAAVLCAVLALAIFHGKRKVFLAPPDAGFLDRVALVTVIVYLPRFFLLPDQLEYFILPMAMSIVYLSRNLRSLLVLALVMLSITLNSLVEISLFARDGRHIMLSPRLAEGAVAQDWDARKLLHAREDPAFQDYVDRAVYGDLPARPRLAPDNYLDGFLSNSNDLVIGQSSAYQIGDPAFGNAPAYQRASYRHIYICDADLGPRYAWRVLQAAPSLQALRWFQDGKGLRCQTNAG